MRSALITGASSGFGQQVALELAQQGWLVVATMRDLGKSGVLHDTAQSLCVADRIHVVPMDVADSNSVRNGLDKTLDITGGSLDLLFNNAGYTSLGFFEDTTDADCRAVMETNFFGALAVTRAVVPLMRTAGHGRIAFVSSNAVNSPHPTMAMYAASKWALEGFAEALAMELAPAGVDVVVIQPGNHRTAFASNVSLIRPDDSPYSDIWDKLIPELSKLGAIGAETASAIPTFLEALTAPNPAFLNRVGNDVALFGWMKRTLTYEHRASFIREFVGFPGRTAEHASNDSALDAALREIASRFSKAASH